jgi:hypothetical protein
VNIDLQAAAQLLKSMLDPWYAAIAEPIKAQEEVLHRLLLDYA